MNLTIQTGVPVLTVFIQGILSFFSPCILPLVPLYIGYLAGGAQKKDEDGNVVYSRKKIFIHTLFFIIGISFAFILLGLGFTAVGKFFSGSRIWFVRIGGIIMVLFGLYQLGIFGKSGALEREHRFGFRFEKWTMNPLIAFVFGFTFSFAWTPCVGPTLASVLLMASSAGTAAAGFALIGVYMLGFVLPFLLVGLFTGTVLDFFKKHQNVIKYTAKAGGVLLILMGVMTFTGWMNGFSSYLSSATGISSSDSGNREPASDTKGTGTESTDMSETDTLYETSGTDAQTEESETETSARKVIPAPDFTLKDQDGNEHTLSDYKGKTVFLNFWATWCGPCQKEMPDIQELYEAYGENAKDLVILGVANPRSEEYPKNSDVTQEEVIQFLEDNGYNYPVAMDTTGDIFAQYGISAFPTTFMIDKEGNIYGYVTGTLTKDIMENIIQQTMDSIKD